VSNGSFWLGLGLAGGAIALSILGFSLMSDSADDAPPQVVQHRLLPPNPLSITAPTSMAIEIPMIAARQPSPLDLLELDDQSGRRVYRIRATPYGDELIVDAETGKLLAVKDVNGKITRHPPTAEG
jgi:hypothetical protein